MLGALAQLAAVTLLTAPVEPGAVLCVELGDSTGIRGDELVAVLQARIARHLVRVETCTGGSSPTWRVVVKRPKAGLVTLSITGRDFHAEPSVRVNAGLRQEQEDEIVRSVALTVTEALRPSIDIELAREKRAAVEAEAPKLAPAAAPAEASSLRGWSLGADGGPLIGLDQGRTAGFLHLNLSLDLRLFTTVLFIGGYLLPSAQKDGSSVSSRGLELGAGILGRWRRLEAGLSLQARLIRVDLRNEDPDIGSSHRTRWSGGLGIHSRIALLTYSRWELGLLIQGSIWPRPRRYLVQGAPVLTEPYVELLMGPAVRLSL